jgi:hypothetical protein
MSAEAHWQQQVYVCYALQHSMLRASIIAADICHDRLCMVRHARARRFAQYQSARGDRMSRADAARKSRALRCGLARRSGTARNSEP